MMENKVAKKALALLVVWGIIATSLLFPVAIAALEIKELELLDYIDVPGGAHLVASSPAPPSVKPPTVAQIDFTARNIGEQGSVLAPSDGYIYYVEGPSVYRMGSKGQNKTRMINMNPSGDIGEGRPMYLQTYDGYLYYFNPINSAIYRFKSGSKSQSIFIENAGRFVIGGNTLYYGTPSGQYIKSVNLATGKKAVVYTSNSRVEPVNFLQDTVVFRRGNQAGLLNPRNGRTAFYGDEVLTMQARGSYVYYYDDSDDILYRAKLNTSNLSLIDESAFISVGSGGYYGFISGDYIYYYEEDGYDLYCYRWHISTQKSTPVACLGDSTYLDHLLMQPCGDYLYDLNMWQGFITHSGGASKTLNWNEGYDIM